MRAHLARLGIGSEVHYPIPDHLQAVERRAASPSLPHTEAACGEVLTLPCFPGMTDADVDRVAAAIRDYCGATHDR